MNLAKEHPASRTPLPFAYPTFSASATPRQTHKGNPTNFSLLRNTLLSPASHRLFRPCGRLVYIRQNPSNKAMVWASRILCDCVYMPFYGGKWCVFVCVCYVRKALPREMIVIYHCTTTRNHPVFHWCLLVIYLP